MKGYLNGMQAAAARRVSEMQRRAQKMVEESNATLYGTGVHLPGTGETDPENTAGTRQPTRQGGHFYAPFSPPMGGFPQQGNKNQAKEGAASRAGQQGQARPAVAASPSRRVGKQQAAGASQPHQTRMSRPSGMPSEHGRSPGMMPQGQNSADNIVNRLIRGLSSSGSQGGSLFDSIGGSVQDALASVSGPVTRALEALHIDNERLVILVIMLLVLNEHGDKTLLLALGYLLL